MAHLNLWSPSLMMHICMVQPQLTLLPLCSFQGVPVRLRRPVPVSLASITASVWWWEARPPVVAPVSTTVLPVSWCCPASASPAATEPPVPTGMKAISPATVLTTMRGIPVLWRCPALVNPASTGAHVACRGIHSPAPVQGSTQGRAVSSCWCAAASRVTMVVNVELSAAPTSVSVPPASQGVSVISSCPVPPSPVSTVGYVTQQAPPIPASVPPSIQESTVRTLWPVPPIPA